MIFKSAVLTDVGRELLARAHAGEKITWTNAGISFTQLNEADIPGMTTVAVYLNTTSLNVTVADDICTVTASFTNSEMTSGMFARGCCVFAKIGNEAPVLVAVAVSNGSSSYINAGFVGILNFVVDFGFKVSSASSVNLELSTTGYATAAALQATNASVQKLDESCSRCYESLLHAAAYAKEGEIFSVRQSEQAKVFTLDSLDGRNFQKRGSNIPEEIVDFYCIDIYDRWALLGYEITTEDDYHAFRHGVLDLRELLRGNISFSLFDFHAFVWKMLGFVHTESFVPFVIFQNQENDRFAGGPVNNPGGGGTITDIDFGNTLFIKPTNIGGIACGNTTAGPQFRLIKGFPDDGYGGYLTEYDDFPIPSSTPGSGGSVIYDINDIFGTFLNSELCIAQLSSGSLNRICFRDDSHILDNKTYNARYLYPCANKILVGCDSCFFEAQMVKDSNGYHEYVYDKVIEAVASDRAMTIDSGGIIYCSSGKMLRYNGKELHRSGHPASFFMHRNQFGCTGLVTDVEHPTSPTEGAYGKIILPTGNFSKVLKMRGKLFPFVS